MNFKPLNLTLKYEKILMYHFVININCQQKVAPIVAAIVSHSLLSSLLLSSPLSFSLSLSLSLSQKVKNFLQEMLIIV